MLRNVLITKHKHTHIHISNEGQKETFDAKQIATNAVGTRKDQRTNDEGCRTKKNLSYFWFLLSFFSVSGDQKRFFSYKINVSFRKKLCHEANFKSLHLQRNCTSSRNHVFH